MSDGAAAAGAAFRVDPRASRPRRSRADFTPVERVALNNFDFKHAESLPESRIAVAFEFEAAVAAPLVAEPAQRQRGADSAL